eukprot:5379013-Lingulodinium_polyedra.AAC.1
MKGLTAQQDKMRRAADALEGCIGMLGARTRQCLDELDDRKALQVPVPGGDGEELSEDTGRTAAGDGASQRTTSERMIEECNKMTAHLRQPCREAEKVYGQD